MKYDITTLRAAAVEWYRTTDWNAVLARGALLYITVTLAVAYLNYLNLEELGGGWTPARIGVGVDLPSIFLFAGFFIAPVLAPLIWLGIRALVGRWRHRRVDVGSLAGPPVLSTVLTVLVLTYALLSANTNPAESSSAFESLQALGEFWLILTGVLALPWAAAVVVVGWHRRGPRIPTRAAAGIVLAVCVVLAGVPAAAVAVTDSGSDSSTEPAESEIEYNGTDDGDDYDYLGIERGTYQFDRGELACGPVERRPGTLPGIQNATRGYEPVALHNVSEPVAVAPLVNENGTQVDRDRRWLVDLGLEFQRPVTAGSFINDPVQPAEISSGGYTADGVENPLWIVGEEVDFEYADQDELHLYWDVVHPNGTVHRYATKVCLPEER